MERLLFVPPNGGGMEVIMNTRNIAIISGTAIVLLLMLIKVIQIVTLYKTDNNECHKKYAKCKSKNQPDENLLNDEEI